MKKLTKKAIKDELDRALDAGETILVAGTHYKLFGPRHISCLLPSGERGVTSARGYEVKRLVNKLYEQYLKGSVA